MFSCDSDDENGSVTPIDGSGEFSIDGQTYPLEELIFAKHPDEDKKYGIALIAGDYHIDVEEEELTGENYDYLSFSLISKNSTSLSEGRYELSNSDEAMTFGGFIGLDHSSEDHQQGKDYETDSAEGEGFLSIFKDGDVYTIKFSAEITDGDHFPNKILSGQYVGPIDYQF